MKLNAPMIDVMGGYSHAKFIASDNFNQRPKDSKIDLLVIHSISLPEGIYGTPYIVDLFLNRLDCAAHPDFKVHKQLEVSAHFLILRTGEIYQFVSTLDRAWHAGTSSFKGQENCNDFSIGIELEGTDHTPFEPIQYEKLAALTGALQARHPDITQDRICGHEDIAPGRKTDPGSGFDWVLYRSLC